MTELSFEWDPGKAAINALKHGITFEEAKTVFHDEYALLIDDPDHSKSEDRFILMGRSTARRSAGGGSLFPSRRQGHPFDLGSAGREAGKKNL
jgi:hypothetical protein